MNAFQRAFGCTDLIEVNAESARSGLFTFSDYKYVFIHYKTNYCKRNS